MRKTLLMTAAALGLTAGAALAQTTTAPSQTIRPGHEPGVGESYPASNQASNINGSDSRSTIAPRLPAPPGSEGAGPEQFIHDAQRALARHRTGEAQEAIERAQTRLLDRSVVAGQTNTPAENPMVAALEAARQDLARHDFAGANRHLNAALSQTAAAGGMPMAAPMSGGAGGMGNGSMGNAGMSNGGMGNGPASGDTLAPPSPGSTPPGMSDGMTPNAQ